MSEIIDYLDRDRLKISFSTLIIRVSSVNRHYGRLSEFVRDTNLYGVTNGKIHLMAEMMEPPYGLYNLADNHLIPLDLEEGRDYVFVTEQLAKGIDGKESPFLNQPHPDLKNIPWLESLITREGNYVWYKETEKEKKSRLEKKARESSY